MPRIFTTELPTTGWSPSGPVLDAKTGDPGASARCELCGTKIRWVHLLEHPAFHRVIECGCCCAARICDFYDAVEAETSAMNRAQRLARFLDPEKWKESQSGNPTRTVENGKFRATIFSRAGRWSYCVSKKGGESKFPDSFFPYSSKREALIAAFDRLDELRRESR